MGTTKVSVLGALFLFSGVATLTLWPMPEAAAKRPFYAIAHMTNTSQAVRWAVGKGANAVEVDLNFTDKGDPLKFLHGGVCDCICYSTLLSGSGHVCSQLGSFGNRCEAQAPAVDLMHEVASHPSLALLIIDSKMVDRPAAVQKYAGGKVMTLLNDHLFGRGYRGKVIVSVSKRSALEYLREIARLAPTSKYVKYVSRIYFSIDQEGGEGFDAADTLRQLVTLPSKNRAYGTGISACAPGGFHDAIRVARQNIDAGSVAMAYIWSLNKTGSMEDYINDGATGVMTNFPGDAVAVAHKKGLTLAKPEDPFPAVTSDKIVGGGCDCDYHPGGCRISKQAPQGQACKCKYKGAWTCGASTVACNQSNPLCRNPDTSVAACALGGGDCDGYKEAKCDCNYHPGGCSISKAAPGGAACQCNYKGAWTCGGSVVRCRDENAPLCKKPDTSVASCIQGGGDCDGYKQASCDCNYHSGGCSISKPAPLGTACKCNYKGAWTCSGSVVRCKNESSPYCKKPDASKASCLLGGGDCDAKNYR